MGDRKPATDHSRLYCQVRFLIRLSEMPYEAFIASIAPYVGEFDSPLRVARHGKLPPRRHEELPPPWDKRGESE